MVRIFARITSRPPDADALGKVDRRLTATDMRLVERCEMAQVLAEGGGRIQDSPLERSAKACQRPQAEPAARAGKR